MMEENVTELVSGLRIENSVINIDTTGRIKRFLNKANAGETLTVAFLGGSITQGSLASTQKNCYAYRTYDWLQKNFKADFSYVNAGIGATTSHLGVARVEEDVLSQQPDLVIVEFSVNDEDESPHFQETYEGLVRKILGAEWEPAVLLVHNVRYNDGGNAEAIHKPIGRHYGLPEVSMREAIYPLISQDGLDPREITPDDLHPNDLGHALVSYVICSYFESVRKELTAEESANQDGAGSEKEATDEWSMPSPITKNRYETAKRYRNDALKPLKCIGFIRDDAEQSQISDCFKKGYLASHTGDKIVFSGCFSQLAIQYRKTVRKPAPIALAIVDGDEKNAVVLDSNFKEDWGDCLYLEVICEDLEYKEHEVEIRLVKSLPEDQEGFYLVSLIYA